MGVLVALIASSASAGMLSKGSTGIPYRTNGKTATFGDGPRTAVPNTNLGNGSIGNTGWYRGGEAIAHPSNPSSFIELGAKGETYLFPGTKYPFQAGYQVPAKDIALGALGMLPLGRGALLAVGLFELMQRSPAIQQWFNDAGVGINPNATSERDAFLAANDGACTSDCHYWDSNYVPGQKFTSLTDACKAGLGAQGLTFDYAAPVFAGGTIYRCNATGGAGSSSSGRLESRSPDPVYPKSMDDIAPYLMRTPFHPSMVGDIVTGGGTINLPEPNITGPSSIQGEPVTSTSTGTQTINGQQVPTRTETKTQTTYNFTTNNNQVTNTTNTTTTTTNTYNQSTGVLINTDTSEKTETPEEKEQVVDSPLGPVPKLYDQKYPEGLTGVWNGKKAEFAQTGFFTMIDQLTPKVGQAGSCPSWTIDLSWTPGASMGVHQLQPPCMIWPILKTIVIITALFLARALIFGG